MTKLVRLLGEKIGEILSIFDRIAELPLIRDTVTHRILDRFSSGFQHLIDGFPDYLW